MSKTKKGNDSSPQRRVSSTTSYSRSLRNSAGNVASRIDACLRRIWDADRFCTAATERSSPNLAKGSRYASRLSRIRDVAREASKGARCDSGNTQAAFGGQIRRLLSLI